MATVITEPFFQVGKIMINKRCFLVVFASVFFSIFSSSLFADFLDDVVAEINYVRTRPQEYAQKRLVPRLKNYKGLDYYIDSKNKVPTKEGAKACKECIEVLKKQKPLLPLTMDKFLCISADMHAKDQMKTGQMGSQGSDGSWPNARIEKAGFKGSQVGENVAYGSRNAIDIVLSLMIDDGVSDRGRRSNFLDPDFDKIGVAFVKGGKAAHGSVCVIDFGGGVKQNAPSPKQSSGKVEANKKKNTNAKNNSSMGGNKGKDDFKDEDGDYYDGEDDDYDNGGDYDGGNYDDLDGGGYDGGDDGDCSGGS